MKHSILICSVYERENQLKELLKVFFAQGDFVHVGASSVYNVGILSIYQDLTKGVEILVHQDNKQISVGAKSQLLLNESTGDYINRFDDDDLPYHYYIDAIQEAIKTNPDCVGFPIDMTTNGQNPQRCCHSLKYKQWRNNVDGWDFVRNVTHFNPVKRKLALKIGFRNLRFGEDKHYSDRITRICRTEVYIEQPLFHYRYSNKIEHSIKYGIK